MSFKFRWDGACFPTKVCNGCLEIVMGSSSIKFPHKLFTEDYPLDNGEYPVCNIMCYLKNDKYTIVMRFDGTITKYNSDGVVIGLSKFNRKDIYANTLYLPVGIVAHGSYKTNKHTKCSIYSVAGSNSNEYFLECVGDAEPLMFKPEDNVGFISEVMKGTRVFPRIRKVGPNSYIEDSGRYSISGVPIKVSGYHVV